MVEDESENETETEQKGDSDTVPDKKNIFARNDVNIVNEAKEEIKAKQAILDREEALQTRREELHARQQLGGYSNAGQLPPEPKEPTDKELAEKFSEGEMDILK